MDADIETVGAADERRALRAQARRIQLQAVAVAAVTALGVLAWP